MGHNRAFTAKERLLEAHHCPRSTAKKERRSSPMAQWHPLAADILLHLYFPLAGSAIRLSVARHRLVDQRLWHGNFDRKWRCECDRSDFCRSYPHSYPYTHLYSAQIGQTLKSRSTCRFLRAKRHRRALPSPRRVRRPRPRLTWHPDFFSYTPPAPAGGGKRQNRFAKDKP